MKTHTRIICAVDNPALRRWFMRMKHVVKQLRKETYWKRVYLPQIRDILRAAGREC